MRKKARERRERRRAMMKKGLALKTRRMGTRGRRRSGRSANP